MAVPTRPAPVPSPLADDGVLFFPVTPFWPDGDLNLASMDEHVRQRLDDAPAAIFAACGTGEFHALSTDEIHRIALTAVKAAGGGVPVFVGAGGGWADARAQAAAAESAGADGILLMPPALVSGPQQGLVGYVRAVAAASSLPIVVYNRGTAAFTAAAAVEVTRIPTVVGLKDGIGDVEALSRLTRAVVAAAEADGRPAPLLFDGLPTAEVTVPAYRAIGVTRWSSAVFCFAPAVSKAFHRAVATGDGTTSGWLLDEFFHPLVQIRDRVPGYAVSLIKGMAARGGLAAGPVRPPLVDARESDLDELEALTANTLQGLRRRQQT